MEKKKSIEDKLDYFAKFVLGNTKVFNTNIVHIADKLETHSHIISVNDVVDLEQHLKKHNHKVAKHNHDKRYSKIDHEHSKYSKKRDLKILSHKVTNHTHSIKDITYLQNELNKYISKECSTKRHNHDRRYSKIDHEHSEYSERRDLKILSHKVMSHKHSIEDINNLQNELNKYISKECSTKKT